MPNLQELVNAASSGATIQHDVEYVGSLMLNKPVTIQGTGTIRTPNAGPAVDIPPGTGPVVLRGLEICTTAGWALVHDIIRWGAWQATNLADVPQGLTLDSCDIHGQPNQNIQNGLAANGANLLISKTKIREIHHDDAESHCFCAWNGPGPFKIYDSYFEGGHIGILFGGAEARIPNLVPSNIEIKRVHSIIPLAWKGSRKNKNRLEFKNAQDVLVDGFIAENSWVQSQIGYGILVTVRNEKGLNPWAVCKRIKLTNIHMKTCAGGFQIIGQDDNAAAVAGAGSDLTISNVLIELSKDMGDGTTSNGRLLSVQAFNNLKVDRITANPWHSYLNLEFSSQGSQSPGLALTNSVLAQGEWGFFGDSDKPLSAFSPDGKITGNMVYGPTGTRPKFAGNTYVNTLPATIPAGVGVDMTVLKAALEGIGTVPPTEPIPPTPTPNPPTDSIPAVAIVSPLNAAIIMGQSTISATATDPTGINEVYLIVDDVVVTGKNAAPYDFTVDTTKVADGQHSIKVRAWSKAGKAGDSEKITVTVKNAVTPPSPTTIRSVEWPKQIGKQNQIIEAQWRERFRLRAIREGVKSMAEFEHVPA